MMGSGGDVADVFARMYVRTRKLLFFICVFYICAFWNVTNPNVVIYSYLTPPKRRADRADLESGLKIQRIGLNGV